MTSHGESFTRPDRRASEAPDDAYVPTRLDKVCKYAVGSFVAVGLAGVGAMISTSSASASQTPSLGAGVGMDFGDFSFGGFSGGSDFGGSTDLFTGSTSGSTFGVGSTLDFTTTTTPSAPVDIPIASTPIVTTTPTVEVVTQSSAPAVTPTVDFAPPTDVVVTTETPTITYTDQATVTQPPVETPIVATETSTTPTETAVSVSSGVAAPMTSLPEPTAENISYAPDLSVPTIEPSTTTYTEATPSTDPTAPVDNLTTGDTVWEPTTVALQPTTSGDPTGSTTESGTTGESATSLDPANPDGTTLPEPTAENISFAPDLSVPTTEPSTTTYTEATPFTDPTAPVDNVTTTETNWEFASSDGEVTEESSHPTSDKVTGDQGTATTQSTPTGANTLVVPGGEPATVPGSADDTVDGVGTVTFSDDSLKAPTEVDLTTFSDGSDPTGTLGTALSNDTSFSITLDPRIGSVRSSTDDGILATPGVKAVGNVSLGEDVDIVGRVDLGTPIIGKDGDVTAGSTTLTGTGGIKVNDLFLGGTTNGDGVAQWNNVFGADSALAVTVPKNGGFTVDLKDSASSKPYDTAAAKSALDQSIGEYQASRPSLSGLSTSDDSFSTLESADSTGIFSPLPEGTVIDSNSASWSDFTAPTFSATVTPSEIDFSEPTSPTEPTTSLPIDAVATAGTYEGLGLNTYGNLGDATNRNDDASGTTGTGDNATNADGTLLADSLNFQNDDTTSGSRDEMGEVTFTDDSLRLPDGIDLSTLTTGSDPTATTNAADPAFSIAFDPRLGTVKATDQDGIIATPGIRADASVPLGDDIDIVARGDIGIPVAGKDGDVLLGNATITGTAGVKLGDDVFLGGTTNGDTVGKVTDLFGDDSSLTVTVPKTGGIGIEISDQPATLKTYDPAAAQTALDSAINEYTAIRPTLTPQSTSTNTFEPLPPDTVTQPNTTTFSELSLPTGTEPFSTATPSDLLNPTGEPQPSTPASTLIASAGNLNDLGITYLADNRTENDGSRPPVYVPRSDGLPEGSSPATNIGSVEIYVPPPTSSVIPSDRSSVETPTSAGSAVQETSPTVTPFTPEAPATDTATESTYDWGPVTFATVGIPFGAFGKVVAGQSQGLPLSVAVGDAAWRSPVAFVSDVAVRTALKNPIGVTENEGVNRLFTSAVGGGVGVAIDKTVKTYYNPIASTIAGREVNAASGLSPVTLGVLPIAETAFQVGANAIEESLGVCTPNSTDTFTYACNSAISGGITTATWAGGIAEDLKRQEVKRVTAENIACGCSDDGALTAEQQAQIQANYTKNLRNVGLAVGTQSGVTALMGAPGKSSVVTETCPTSDGSYDGCFTPADGSTPTVPPSTGGDNDGTPPAVPPSSGGGAVRIDGSAETATDRSTVPACSSTCKADYETEQKPVDTFESQVSPSSPVIFDSSFGKAPVWRPDPAAQKPTTTTATATSPDDSTRWSQIKVPTKVMDQQIGGLFGYPMPATSVAAKTTPAESTPSTTATRWSTVKAPTTPVVVDSSTSWSGAPTEQNGAKPTTTSTTKPAVTTKPTTTQQQKPSIPDAGTAPLDPWINVPLDVAEQGLTWVFKSGVWALVKTGEVVGGVGEALSPFGGWSTQP
ncbi:MAG: hypothetical protein RI885_739 [Actinomycetota bacterium]